MKTRDIPAIETIKAILETEKELSFKAGIKEVVEWVNNHLHESPACSYKWCFGDRTWQSKLKEWGLAHDWQTIAQAQEVKGEGE